MIENQTTPASLNSEPEKNREREIQFETCVAVFKEVYSLILSLNALFTEHNDAVFDRKYVAIFSATGPLIKAVNLLMGAYLKEGDGFAEQLAIYFKEKKELSQVIDKDFEHHFSFSRKFPEEAEISQYMRKKDHFIAGVSAVHSFGNDLFAFSIQSETLQNMRDEYQTEGSLGKKERMEFLDLEVKRQRERLAPIAGLIIRDLKEGYYTEQGDVRKFATAFRNYSALLFDQLFESIKEEKMMGMPYSSDILNPDRPGVLLWSSFSERLLKQWVKDSLENAYKAFRARVDAKKISARFKSLRTTDGPSLNESLQNTDQFADNRPIPETFRIQLEISRESEGGVDYAVFAIVDNGMGIEGESKKFVYGQGGYDGKQPSSAMGMALLAQSMRRYSVDMELRTRTDSKKGTKSILRIPIEQFQVMPEFRSSSSLDSAESFAS